MAPPGAVQRYPGLAGYTPESARDLLGNIVLHAADLAEADD